MMKPELLLRSSIIAAGIAVAVAAFAAPARCGYPPAQDKYVNDYAGVMTPGDKASVETMLKELEKGTGIQASVLTIGSVSQYTNGAVSIETFAKELFNSWGIGNKKTDNGVLILVAVKDRACRIQLGSGYPGRYDETMREVVAASMLPYFKNAEYSRGIFEGTRAVIEKITVKVSWFEAYKWHLLAGVLLVFFVFAGISARRSGRTGWGWVCFAAAGALAIFLFEMLSKGKSSDGFGGGKSSGGGATGNW